MKTPLHNHGDGRITDAVGKGFQRLDGGALSVALGDESLCRRPRIKVFGNDP